MRIRTVKPEYFGHPVMRKLSDGARLAALAMLCMADDEGYFICEPQDIRSVVWPLDECSTNARRALDECSRAGWIEVFETQNHGAIAHVINFEKHQRIDRPSTSKLKGYIDSTSPRRMLDEPSLLEQGTGNKGKEQGTVTPLPPVGAVVKSFKSWTLEEFTADCMKANVPEVLTKAEVQQFINYWTEPTARGKFKLATQDTWETRRRMENALRMIFEAKRKPATTQPTGGFFK